MRIDVSLRQEVVETRRALVTPEYDDVSPFVVTVLTPEHLMAEKVRALLVRSKPRDVYDLWLLSRRGAKLNHNLVATKLALYDMTPTVQDMEAALEKVQMDWERDLRPLLPQFIAWDEVSQELDFLTQGIV